MAGSMSACILVVITFVVFGPKEVFTMVSDIYSGEHLDDVIMKTDGSDVTDKSVVLVVYDGACANQLEKHEINDRNLPLAKYVTLLRHDYVTSLTHTWYGYNGDDIRQRYDVTSCWEVMFIRKGSRKGDKPRKWSPDLDRKFSDWVWDQVRVPVTITNSNDYQIIVHIEPGIHRRSGPHTYEPLHMGSRQSVTQMVPRSYTVYAIPWEKRGDGRHYLGFWRVGEAGSINIQHTPKQFYQHQQEIRQTMEREQSEIDLLENRIWGHQSRHLINLKQPLIMPNFTRTGYMRRYTPQRVHELLYTYYRKHVDGARMEEDQEHVINNDVIRTTMVNVPRDVIEEVSREIEPILEEWSGVDLEMTYFYGVREYYNGSVLRNHVDRIESHVISAIFQIDRNLGDGPDWPLEVITYGGDRQEVYLTSGEMLLYESARLVHGRPRAFRGNYFANAFLHYRPVEGWEGRYRFDNGVLYYPEGNREGVNILPSPLTGRFARKRDLLPRVTQDGHGEL